VFAPGEPVTATEKVHGTACLLTLRVDTDLPDDGPVQTDLGKLERVRVRVRGRMDGELLSCDLKGGDVLERARAPSDGKWSRWCADSATINSRSRTSLIDYTNQ